MSTRTPTIGGNWKMNLHKAEAIELAAALAAKADDFAGVEVTVFPAFPYLIPVADALAPAGGKIKLGAQDAYITPNGAFTGEVSLSMIQDAGASVLLVGHSERRHVIGETDILVNDKVLAGLEAGLDVVLAIGETLEQRESGKTDAINTGQLGYGLAGVTAEQMKRITIAYEPVWAIGTGKTATPEDAQKAHSVIRQAVAFLYDQGIADAVRIQYGGSMKPGNAGDLLAQTDIDGGLIGGAALKPDDFAGIIAAAK
ncbi:triose-phosphate isomerase [Mucisphaera calidilacus]|uniref:Triosephosphate isomerase n=1 Tax=Mucisphaera calidilacus TaxID=2527982 RepID=A0A518BTQ8_9BACT|nr:triose-phosphate isomerase [Mucisphaera calidilacus]QDU70356.1 Triosephosphate isomerase [Mucisphaera calidilacus]